MNESGLHHPVNRGKINKKALVQELETIFAEGYAYSIGEQDADTTGISYPIYDYRNRIVAALAVSGLSSHFEGENLAWLKAESRHTADTISRQLGYRGPDF